ncbi:hypothetical protein WN944_005708 [Citrus x changshan-huyou]|uniref:Uncharacterized protein n=1 Tax=Citrus x changshan-huyou TaxID=2935761 RepID=A0AAP0MHS7_9ROSI
MYEVEVASVPLAIETSYEGLERSAFSTDKCIIVLVGDARVGTLVLQQSCLTLSSTEIVNTTFTRWVEIEENSSTISAVTTYITNSSIYLPYPPQNLQLTH